MSKIQYVNSGGTLVAGAVLYTGPCVLHFAHAVHDSGSAAFIQLHDAASAPSDGAVPLITHSVKANSDATIEQHSPVVFENGVYMCESSTAPTKTLAGGAHIFFAAGLEERPAY